MSLYGYGRETNPLLEKRNDIKVFDDVVSPYSNTLNSVLTILSESNLINKKEVTKSINVFDVFHSAGFKTYWLSNQSPIGIWDNQVTVFANQADVTKFVNISGNSSFEAMMLSSYDAKLFKPFITSLNDSTKRKFIVLHLMGSHSSYSKRYPDKFDVFKGNGDKEELIAQYDNSILYNDFIVDSIFRILKSHAGKNKIATAIYLSDHGENVYDESDRVGHDYSGVLPKSNVEIPFIVWLSDKYQTEHPDKVKQIKSAMHKPFVSDDLFHTILDLNCIETPAFKPEHSLFNPKFFSGRKRVLEDEMDYDKKQERFRSPS
jgi:heptose-I-phosphate ethanolaminephosphotransferase